MSGICIVSKKPGPAHTLAAGTGVVPAPSITMPAPIVAIGAPALNAAACTPGDESGPAATGC